jgi:outer membrane biosynthesis protein TonB
MEFTIGEDGNAIDVKPLESPNELFSKSAIESLQKSRFGPRYVQGVPKSTRIKQAIVFRDQKPAMNRASAK